MEELLQPLLTGLTASEQSQVLTRLESRPAVSSCTENGTRRSVGAAASTASCRGGLSPIDASTASTLWG